MLAPANWLPFGSQFTVQYGAPGAVWIWGAGPHSGALPGGDCCSRGNRLAGGSMVVFSAAAGDQFTLNVGSLDASAPLQTIATLSAYPIFDAAAPQASP